MKANKISDVDYSMSVRDFLKSKRKQLGGNKELYRALYGEYPTEKQNQALINLINRGSLTASFLGLCTKQLGLNEVTLGVLFSLDKPGSVANRGE